MVLDGLGEGFVGEKDLEDDSGFLAGAIGQQMNQVSREICKSFHLTFFVLGIVLATGAAGQKDGPCLQGPSSGVDLTCNGGL